VQVDPVKPTLKAPGRNRLKLIYDTSKVLSKLAFKLKLRRYSLVLVSSRMLFADVLMESVEEGVAAVYFDWRFSSLDKIIYECKAKCG
jgi:hypothetical protein